MEALRPIDKLRIQGNSTIWAEVSTKKTALSNGTDHNLAEATTNDDLLIKQVTSNRRYVFPDRAVWSDYGSPRRFKDTDDLTVSGKAINWDSEFTPPAVAQPKLRQPSNGSVSYSQVLNEVVSKASRDGAIETLAQPTRNDQTILPSFVENSVDKQHHSFLINRNNKLRHSYHGVSSLSLAGMKISTPRMSEHGTDRVSSFSAQPSPHRKDMSVTDTMPVINRSLMEQKSQNVMDTSNKSNQQRTVPRSAYLKQCLFIQKSQHSEEIPSDADEKAINQSYELSMESKEKNKPKQIRKYYFQSLDSYLNYNNDSVHQVPQYKRSPSGKLVSLLAHRHSDIGQVSLTRALSNTKRDVPIHFSAVRKYPNLNGQWSDQSLTIVGSSPAGQISAELETVKQPGVRSMKENLNPVETSNTTRASGLNGRTEQDNDLQELTLTSFSLLGSDS